MVVDSEEYFPRGKATPAVAKADGGGGGDSGKGIKGGKRAKLGNKMENLFTNTEEKPKKKVKKSKNKLTPGEEKTLAGNRRGVEEKKFSVVPLTYDQIVEGMLSIGIVSRIRDHEMYISLPGRTGGTVSITNISTPYLNIMEKYAGEKPTTDDDVCVYTLKDLFQIGQQVVVKVAKVERSETSTKISLTMNPKDLHEFYSTTMLKEDLVMIAAIQSKEDHGYVMDVGINGARCFLPEADANKLIKANRNRPLGIGQLMYCKIKKIQFHRLIANITFTVMSKIVRLQKMDEIPTLNYTTLIPGMLVDAIVMETHKTGIMVHCMDLNGLIYQDHMSERWTSPETLEIGSTVPARVLYTLPNLTSPYLTLQTDLLPLAQTGDRTDSKKLGAKLEVRVVRIEKRGIIVRFEDDDKGIIPINHIGNEALLTSDDISKKYKKHSTHPCRVLQYSPVERMYLCSFKKEKLNSDVVHIQQANCGKVVSCKILGWNKGGACVQVGSAMQGFIPNTLYKKNTLSDSTKEKLIGTTIKARIMQRDIEQNKIVLTAHKELVTSNGVVLTSVDEAEVGMKGHAIIKSFNKYGAYVNTIGGVEGFIPASKLNRVRLADFKEAHHIGQIIEYKVLEKNNEKNHLVMTAIIEDEEDNSEVSPKKGRKEKRKLSINNESESQKENGESEPSKKKKRKKNKKKKSVPETVNDDDCELAPEANEMEVDIKSESSDLEEDVDSEELVIKSETIEDELEPSAIGFWNAEVKVKDEPISDSDEEPDQSKSKKKKKSRAVADVPETVVNSEQNLEQLSITNESLELVIKFENGDISSPNDPEYWKTLISYYSALGHLDKARGVAKQALDTIDYRNEKGKLEVWGSLLQLEMKYGTEETVKKTYAEAFQRNDEFDWLKLAATVYDVEHRPKDAERIYREMTKKFRLEPEAWIRFGIFHFFKQSFDAGREVLHQALNNVPATQQLLVITKFALLEMHHGDQNKGEQMLDRVLEQHPQRSDLWLVYANGLIKVGDYDKARSVFQRALENNWPPRKVKPLLQRYRELENHHGNESTMVEFQNYAVKVLGMSSKD
ncbi:unnamed protein product [Orchesella dallaii]|uniref:S1 motif domain-containing protein n=1 Tax=Orchesella dallaii TaxID=48710 RepID=A0ABP1RQK6_9HEXA